MSDTVHVTFIYAVGQQVRYTDSRKVYIIVNRTYTEHGIAGPVITYRLARDGLTLDTAYEPDLLPMEEASL